MGFFDSIFGIDIFGDGKPGMLDDAVILGMLEEDERMHRRKKHSYRSEIHEIYGLGQDFDYLIS